MVYEYHCEACAKRFDVIKRATEMEAEERCSQCNSVAARQFVPRRVYFSGTKVEDAEFNPGLGCITKSSAHRKEIAKQKGLIEVGNEKPEVIEKHYDDMRKERRERAWADVDKGWVGEEG